MPRVSYMIPQQGFRPKTNPSGALAGLRGIGVRGLGSGASSSWGPDIPPPVASGEISTGSLLWNWVSSGAGIAYGCYPWDITCANKLAMTKAAQSQIQSVANNAAYYYPDTPAAQVAQDMATQQQAQSSSDVNAVVASVPSPGPMNIPWWLWAVGAFVVVKEL